MSLVQTYLPYVLTAAVSIVAALLGSAGLWGFLARREDRAAEREKSEIERLREDLRIERENTRMCLEKHAAIEERLAAVEAHHSSLIARWIKGPDKRVSWVNGMAMAMIFNPLGLSREAVEGKRFAELPIAPEAIEEIERLDRAARARLGHSAASVMQLNPLLPMMVVAKTAGVGRNQEIIYEGHAFLAEDPASVLARGDEREAEQKMLSQARAAADAGEGRE